MLLPYTPLTLLLIAFIAGQSARASDWPVYGGDDGGQRYSRLSQITPDNVAGLETAWIFKSGEMAAGFSNESALSFQATPIFWNGKLFLSSAVGQVFAVDAATGEEAWRFDPAIPRNAHYAEFSSRGVSIWHAPESRETICSHRIFSGTLTGGLFALDAITGKPCEQFSDNGFLDLRTLAGSTRVGEYTITSPPVVLEDVLIVGSAIGDNGGVELDRGTVTAVDPLDGHILWRFDPIPRSPDNPAYSSWANDSGAITGAANVWAPLSVDRENRLVYLPTTSPSPDFYGGERLGDNNYANSLVALDVDTGKVAWHKQLVHHDVWDYDLPAQPVLFTLQRGGEKLPAVVQATKMGMLFVFNRLTGEPLYEVVERPIPRSDVAGEKLSPTQPFSTLPPLVSQRTITAEDAWGVALFDKWDCQNTIKSLRSEGIYTPPSLQGTLMYPGYPGGSNWGGVSVDEERQVIIANVNQIGAIVRLVPRGKVEAEKAAGMFEGWQLSPMRGTPYAMARRPFLSMLGLPCLAPPWGKLLALDLKSSTILWQKPLGTIEEIAPAIVPDFEFGTPNAGGAITTATGLTFIGAAMDYYLRAFDTRTGEKLWQHSLPRSGMATPMTYQYRGRQYVVIAAGGHGGMGSKPGDYLVAFALPQ